MPPTSTAPLPRFHATTSDQRSPRRQVRPAQERLTATEENLGHPDHEDEVGRCPGPHGQRQRPRDGSDQPTQHNPRGPEDQERSKVGLDLPVHRELGLGHGALSSCLRRPAGVLPPPSFDQAAHRRATRTWHLQAQRTTLQPHGRRHVLRQPAGPYRRRSGHARRTPCLRGDRVEQVRTTGQTWRSRTHAAHMVRVSSQTGGARRAPPRPGGGRQRTDELLGG